MPIYIVKHEDSRPGVVRLVRGPNKGRVRQYLSREFSVVRASQDALMEVLASPTGAPVLEESEPEVVVSSAGTEQDQGLVDLQDRGPVDLGASETE